MPRVAIISVVFAALVFAGSAQGKQYALKHGHCRAHYVRRVERVKVRRHGKVVRVHRVFCVYVAPKREATPSPTIPVPVPLVLAPIVKLHAHLDPSFTQDPSNPAAVEYSYSASATQTVNGLAAAAPSLPEGVLALYSDGLLTCSINVGGATTGGECPVSYSKLGEHTVTTIYSSGSISATETSVEHVEPFSTTTTLNVSAPEECGERQETELRTHEGEGYVYDPKTGNWNKPIEEYERLFTVHYCFYTLSASTVDQNGNPDNEGLRFSVSEFGLTAGKPYRAEVTEVVNPPYTTPWGEGSSGGRDCHIHGFYPYDAGPYCPTAAPATWTITASGGGHPGWTNSQSAPQTITSG
jgi:hypothetical protein